MTTPGEKAKRVGLARNALVDALATLQYHDHTASLGLAAIAVMHLAYVGDADKLIAALRKGEL